MKIIIPDEVIDEAVDNYLSGLFSGRDVIWTTPCGDYRVEIEEFIDKPYEIDFTYYELEDEW